MKKGFSIVLSFFILFGCFGTLAQASTFNIDGFWTSGSYVDEFNDPTGEWYITATASGTFSNSVTTNSEATLRLLLDFKSLGIELFDYNEYPVTNIFSTTTEYEVSIKDSSSDVHHFTASLAPNSSRMFLYTNFVDDGAYRNGDSEARHVYNEIISILESGNPIKISITSGSSHYVFSFNNSGFYREYHYNFGVELKKLSGTELTDEHFRLLELAKKHLDFLIGDAEAKEQVAIIQEMLSAKKQVNDGMVQEYLDFYGEHSYLGYSIGDTLVWTYNGKNRQGTIVNMEVKVGINANGKSTADCYVTVKWDDGATNTIPLHDSYERGCIKEKQR